ncbi:glycosyltransferase family 4 protein [Horticoccus sp. 23ND18S-11]|uniref:glycosyltransferase family 4 protein n=1 Tax=Horticoccus sp. 23ND18S-11 TaxID=3391832 RepID=UPI0039C9732C
MISPSAIAYQSRPEATVDSAARASQPRHLAFVSTFYYPRMRGGAEHSLQHHAESLVQRGIRVSVISLHDGKKPERQVHRGVECHALPAPHFASCLSQEHRAPAVTRALWHVVDVYNAAAGSLLESELRQIGPDLVQTENLPGWSCAAWDAIRRLGLPHVQMLHDFQLTCPAATRFKDGCNCESTCFSCAPFTAIPRQRSQRVEHVVANSRYTRDLYRRLGYFGGARTFDVIYGAVPPVEQTTPIASEPGRLRIGYLGRLHPTKGVRQLIEAFAQVGRPDAVLRIAGRGTDEFEAELRAAAGGHAVEFLGHTPANAFLDAIDVLVVPSLWHEPMGRVVIEAATHGVPVIVATRGGLTELFVEGKTGWAFEPTAPVELVDRLRQVDLATLHAMRSDCRQFAADFAPDPIADRWIALYSRLIAPRTAMGTGRPVGDSASREGVFQRTL